MLQTYKIFVLQTWRRSPCWVNESSRRGEGWHSCVEELCWRLYNKVSSVVLWWDGMEPPNQCLPDFSLTSFPTLEVETDASADRQQGFCFQTPHAHSASEVHSWVKSYNKQKTQATFMFHTHIYIIIYIHIPCTKIQSELQRLNHCK